MDFIKQYMPFQDITEEKEKEDFKIPIQTIDKCYKVNENIINDMELVNDDTAMYHKIYDMQTPFEKLNTSILASHFTDDKQFLKDNQTFIKNCNVNCIDNKTIEDIVELRKDISDETGFIEKYHFVEWEQLKFLNNNATFMKYLSLYEIASPVLTLALPVFLLIMPFFIIRLQGHPVNFTKYTEVLKVVLSILT